MTHAVAIGLAVGCLIACAAGAQDTPAATTTIADQTDVSVTVYNSNLALVRDTRKLSLPTGEVHLQFSDVAQQIRPETVSLLSLSQAGSLVTLEQNYEYDLMSPAKLMEKYVGKEVRLVNYDTQLRFTEVIAKLLSVNESPVFQVGEQIYLGHPGLVVLPGVPENLIAKPTLVWLLNNAQAEQTLQAAYLTAGLNWRADYVITLDRGDVRMDLAGWVTLDNQSGAEYRNAELKLVAGDVNVVRPAPKMERMADQATVLAMAAPPREEAFAEYHLYSLPRRTTIKQNQSKQVSLLSASGIAVTKEYEYAGQPDFILQRIPPIKEAKVSAFLKFMNKADNSLGVPLPAGVMRIYQPDSSGALQFAGEDQIQHTPKDEEVRLRLGNAFDVVAERIQTDYQVVSDRVFQSAFKITLRNHKDVDIVVKVVEPMAGDWTILEKSHDFEKRDANTAVFNLPVPKNGEAVLTYRAQVRT